MSVRGRGVLRLKSIAFRSDERGFTLPEVLTAIAILGILLAIGIISWLGILERRRVDAATNQLVADLRLAHTNATNQLTDWRVVLVPENADEDEGPDYYMVKLAAPYPATSPPVIDPNTPPEPRTFPGNVKIVNIAGTLDTGGWVVWPSVTGQTRTLEFNTDGAMRFYGGVSGSSDSQNTKQPELRFRALLAEGVGSVRFERLAMG